MRYYNGNFISATDQDPSSSSVNGIFNLESHLVHVKAGRWMQTATPIEGDPTLTAAEHYYEQGTGREMDDGTVNLTTNSDANETWDTIPVATATNGRLFVIIATWRDTSSSATTWAEQFNSSDLNYELELKYNTVSGSPTSTTALTWRGAYGASEFNATSIWTGVTDGDSSATADYYIRFHALDNNAHGNFAYSGIVVDNVTTVDYVNIEALAYSEADDTVTSALNLAPNNAAGSTHVLRIASGAASNISSNVIDYNKGGSEPTYTQIGEGDNGTNERHHHAYYFGTHGTQVNMTGTFGDGSTVADDGISGLGCIIGLS